MNSTLWLAAGLCIGLASGAAAQERGTGAIRFQEMDANGDRVITPEEWRGTLRSFKGYDWNGDGQLSGDEVRIGARRRNRSDDRDSQTGIDRGNDWSPARFRTLDRDGDGRLARSEWETGHALFTRADRDQDNFLSAAEFADEADEVRTDQFADLDDNRDGRVTRAEWQGSTAVFDALDANRDGALTRAEAVGTEGGARDEFRNVDANGDGAITQPEWHWNAAAFTRLDANGDGRISRQEFDTSPATVPAQQTPAYRAGYDRGVQEGIQAGKEDKAGPRVWDLEGQRELETADSGYEAHIGDRLEYQTGYRVGFRRGYRDGFGPR